MAEYINIKDVEELIEDAIEDSWELDYTLERLKEINPADVIERSKIDKAIEVFRKEIEKNHVNVIDYADGEWIVKDFVYGAIERFKRNIGE